MYDDRDKALAAGCDAYYSKPVDFHELRVRIQGMLEKKPEA
jgi:DNA-binding response OmpR family regulator